MHPYPNGLLAHQALNKVLKPLEQLVEKLENDISTYENEVAELNRLLIEASTNITCIHIQMVCWLIKH